MTVTVSSKGQVTLPADARRRLGLRAGSRLEIIVRDENRLEVIRVDASVKELKGMLPRPRKTVSLEQMDRAIALGARRSLK